MSNYRKIHNRYDDGGPIKNTVGKSVVRAETPLPKLFQKLYQKAQEKFNADAYKYFKDSYGKDYEPTERDLNEYRSASLMRKGEQWAWGFTFNGGPLQELDSYEELPRYRLGGTPQRTYLMNPKEQEEVFLRDGYIKGQKGDYGLVKKAVNNRDIPIYQVSPDDVSRDRLIPIGNSYGHEATDFLPIEPEYNLYNAGHQPTSYYVDGINGNLYMKSWDLNDYGGGEGFINDLNKPRQLAADFLDLIGNPTVVTTGYKRITRPFYYHGQVPEADPSEYNTSILADVEEHDDKWMSLGDFGTNPLGWLKGKVTKTMGEKGLVPTVHDNKLYYTLPEIVVTPNKK